MSAREMNDQSDQASERRKLLSAAAWAAPIIAVSVAAPAQAASEKESPA